MTRRPRAFTLVEAVVWMSVAVVLISVSSTLVVSLVDASRQARRAADDTRTVLDFLQRFGADVRSSVRVAAGADGRRSGESCVILDVCSGSRVTYSIEGGVVYRIAERRVPVGRAEGVSFEHRNPERGAAGFVNVCLKKSRAPEDRRRFYLMTEDHP